MKISVLTVCRNSAGTIRHTLDSFFRQDFADKELVVVDGGSTDGTLDIVRSYPQERIVLRSGPDRGMYDALNKGLGLFGGDAFGVLNSDDAYHDDRVLSRIAAALTDAEMVHGHLDFVADHADKKIVRRWRAEPKPASGFRSGWAPAHPTFYVRRSVAERVGAFDLSLPTASDYDWMLRAIERSDHRLADIDAVLVDMMLGGKSTSGVAAHLRHNLEALQSRRRWLNSGAVDYALFAKPARKIGQYAPFFGVESAGAPRG